MRNVLFAAALTLAAAPVPALAAETALLIGNERYRLLDRVRPARAVFDAEEALADRGVDTVVARDADRDDLIERIREFSMTGREAEAQAVVLVGRFATEGDEAMFLPIEAEGTGLIDGIATGVPLSAIAEILGRTPGRAVLVLGVAEEEGEEEDDEETDGEGAFPVIDLPDGVTLIVADPANALSFAEDILSEPDADLREAADDDVRVEDQGAVFLTEADLPEEESGEETAAEESYWLLSKQRDDEAAYRSYLDRYPEGSHRDEALARIDRLTETPEERAARIEEALDLDRSARQDVQRDLSVLGYDTRGIDGIFGDGTRQAVRGWQTREGLEATGFLTEEALARLDQQGATRAAELEEEARRRREEIRAADERLWSELGSERSETELVNYLDRYPNGLHAETAGSELDAIQEAAAERDDRDGPSKRERRLWRNAQKEGSVQSYQAYLDAFPQGRFAAESRSGLEQARTVRDRNREAARAEDALNLPPPVRQMVESRLQALGFEPGQADGQFDGDTRAALRRFQQSADLPQTGFMNQITAVRLLADGLRDVLR